MYRKQQSKKVEPPKNTDINLQFEQATHQVHVQEDLYEKLVIKYSDKIDNLRIEAKELIKQNKKKNALFKIKEIQSYEKYISQAEDKKQTFFKLRLQLEQGLQNKNAAEVLTRAAKCLETINPDELEDALSKLEDEQLKTDEINEQFKKFATLGEDQDEIECYMADLEKEIKNDHEIQVPHAKINNQPYNQRHQPFQQQNIYQQYQNQDQGFNDLINAQLEFQ